ncbi:MAG TPA: SRPBCC family protein [Mycobacteriales bacterium]|jgi:uncharacterized protein YndB with AHSA1/START domain|nr:SRPBCC family protein [Mycobacteriales bacterium]
MTTTHVDAGPRKVSRSVDVRASATELFDAIADPHRHGQLDGSGTVKDTVKGPERLSQGAKFSVSMKQYGVPYRITSKVTQYVTDQVLEWQHPAGHRWRWELAAQPDGTTRVTETFDYSTINGLQARVLELMGVPKQNAAGIEATLTKLQQQHAG